MTRIELHIDTLVLHGLPRATRKETAGGLATELTQLFARTDLQAALSAGANIERLVLPAEHFDARTPPARVARSVAAAIHRGLNHGGRS